MMFRKQPWLWFGFGLTAWGCEADSSGEGSEDSAGGAVAVETAFGDAPEAMGGHGGIAALPLPEMGQWETVHPGGETMCARGHDYRFYLRGGDPKKLVIYFQGGGACWDQRTCSIAGAIFSDRVLEPANAEVFGRLSSDGIFDSGEDGLFADWTFLYIPYCTGDVHWGDSTVEYTENLTIHHRGYVNTKAALDYVYERVLEPENVFVTGCSAGAYGSILNAARIGTQYPDAVVSVLADSGAGIITDTFLLDSFPNWNALAHLPDFLERLQAPLETLSIEDVYLSIGESFPQHRFAQYTTAFDQDQTFYWEVMGGDYREFAPRLRSTLDSLVADLPNFRVYYAPGSMHCISFYPFFETREVDGTKFRDWLAQLVEGEVSPPSVQCVGEKCFDDPVCDACAVDGGPGCNYCEYWPDRYLPAGGASAGDAP